LPPTLAAPEMAPRQNRAALLRLGQVPASQGRNPRDVAEQAVLNKEREAAERLAKRKSVALPASLAAPSIAPRQNRASMLRTGPPMFSDSTARPLLLPSRSARTARPSSARVLASPPRLRRRATPLVPRCRLRPRGLRLRPPLVGTALRPRSRRHDRLLPLLQLRLHPPPPQLPLKPKPTAAHPSSAASDAPAPPPAPYPNPGPRALASSVRGSAPRSARRVHDEGDVRVWAPGDAGDC
jgi:hypothetical protein